MQRTLYLHIGAHRTATSSIQKFLHSNFGKIQIEGFFYPFNLRRHFDLINRIFAREVSVADVAADLNRRADGKRYPIHSIVLSDEDICIRKDLGLLAQFRDHFEVKVVFMLRRQDLWIESWYQQNVKWQWNSDHAHLTFEEFLTRRARFFWIDYDERVRHLEKLFGAENVILRVFEKGQMPEGPVNTFCDAIGLAKRDGLLPPPHVNTSLSPLMSEFMRCLPLDALPAKQRREMERACEVMDAEMTAGTRPSALYLDPAARAALMAEYAEGNAALARRRFGRDQLFFDPLPAAEAPLALRTLPDSSYELMQRLVGPFVATLAEQRIAAELALAEKATAEKAAAEAKAAGGGQA
jgi:hypothetical protein